MVTDQTGRSAGSAAAEAVPGIQLSDLHKHFDDVGAVNGVSLALAQGDLLALLGPSGCGKTTTLRLIAGFERLDAGAIRIEGKMVAGDRTHLPPEQRRVGMVFQEYALFPHMSVDDNIRFGLHRYAGDKISRAATVLKLVGLDGLGARMPHELSGGQQQRVALARALGPEPDLVLLDEPFSNLDAGLRVRVRSEVRDILKAAGATAIFVTHDQEEALSLVDQVAVMMDGKVLAGGVASAALPPARHPQCGRIYRRCQFRTGDGTRLSCELRARHVASTIPHRGSGRSADSTGECQGEAGAGHVRDPGA